MKNTGPLLEAQIRIILKEVLLGLHHIHENGIMHRDIKPENIIFKRGFLKNSTIVDFGLAAPVNLKDYLFTRCGTPGYVAPEIANLKS